MSNQRGALLGDVGDINLELLQMRNVFADLKLISIALCTLTVSGRGGFWYKMSKPASKALGSLSGA